MAETPVFDCHVHLPSTTKGRTIEWQPFTPDLKAAASYLRRCGVERAIVACASGGRNWTPESMTATNDETAQAARDYPDLFTASCQVRQALGEAAHAELRRCREELGMVWIGELFAASTDTPQANDALGKVVATATELGMVVQIHADDTRAMDQLCRDFPKATLVLPHPGDSPAEVAERCGLAAKYPNLYIDLSGHGVQRMGVLDLAVRCAGPDRVLFGSDYTVNDPAAVIATIEKSYLSDEVKTKILGGNVMRMLAERGAA